MLSGTSLLLSCMAQLKLDYEYSTLQDSVIDRTRYRNHRRMYRTVAKPRVNCSSPRVNVRQDVATYRRCRLLLLSLAPLSTLADRL